MSSEYVRSQIISFIESNLTDETAIDLSGEFDNLEALLAREGITGRDNWLGLQFIGSDEIPIAVSSTNTTGCYRETGAIFLHIAEKARLGIGALIIARAETIRNAFRGVRIGDILVESVTPVNFNSEATLNFEGGYTSGSVIISYERDLNL